MKDKKLRNDFIRICQTRGPQWVESVIRPLRLKNNMITVDDIPEHALRAIVGVFGPLRRSPSARTPG
jgi:hypothetical protein